MNTEMFLAKDGFINDQGKWKDADYLVPLHPVLCDLGEAVPLYLHSSWKGFHQVCFLCSLCTNVHQK